MNISKINKKFSPVPPKQVKKASRGKTDILENNQDKVVIGNEISSVYPEMKNCSSFKQEKLINYCLKMVLMRAEILSL